MALGVDDLLFRPRHYQAMPEVRLRGVQAMAREGDQEEGQTGNSAFQDPVGDFNLVGAPGFHGGFSQAGDNGEVEAEGSRRDLADETFMQRLDELQLDLLSIHPAGDGGALLSCFVPQDSIFPAPREVGIGLGLVDHRVPVGVGLEHLRLRPGPPEAQVDRDLNSILKEEDPALAAGEVAGDVGEGCRGQAGSQGIEKKAGGNDSFHGWLPGRRESRVY